MLNGNAQAPKLHRFLWGQRRDPGLLGLARERVSFFPEPVAGYGVVLVLTRASGLPCEPVLTESSLSHDCPFRSWRILRVDPGYPIIRRALLLPHDGASPADFPDRSLETRRVIQRVTGEFSWR